MKSIYASKLYRASSRKDRIQAALGAHANLALVKQLAESLDEEYKVPENLGSPQEDKQGKDADGFDDFLVDKEIDPDKDLVTVDDIGEDSNIKPSHSTSHSPSVGTGHKKVTKDDSEEPGAPEPPSESSEPKEENKPADNAPKETEASTTITSSEQISLTVLRDSLNSREDTHGVSRVAEKENEIWIYYKDEINLNNIMTEVIEYLANAGYVTLEFNRLARSDNAIIFEKEVCTEPELKDIESVIEDKKD